MAVYVITSVLAGLASAGYALWGHDAGVFQVLLWYVLGGWVGLGLMVAVVLLGGQSRQSPPPAPRHLPEPQRA